MTQYELTLPYTVQK